MMANHVIKTIYVALAIDPANGDEGVCGVHTAAGWVPLVASDKARLEFVRQAAEQIAIQTKMLVKIAEFSTRIDGQIFDGRF